MMSDVVICEYPLDFDKIEPEMFLPPIWSKFEFQTSSFKNDVFWPDEYNIEDDGTIYKKDVEREMVKTEEGFSEIKESDKGIERVDYTGELNLFGLHLEKESDFEIEIKLLYYKGELKEVVSIDSKKVCNKQRKKEIKKYKEFAEREKFKKESWWYSYAEIYNLIVSIPFYIIRYLFGLAVKICWKIENLIRFKL